MRNIDKVGMDCPHALADAGRMVMELDKGHRSITERIDMLATNAGARSGMRAIYGVKLDAVIKALNELAHCQREIEARCLDAMAVTHGDEAECALEFLTMRGDRFPSDDEQR